MIAGFLIAGFFRSVANTAIERALRECPANTDTTRFSHPAKTGLRGFFKRPEISNYHGGSKLEEGVSLPSAASK